MKKLKQVYFLILMGLLASCQNDKNNSNDILKFESIPIQKYYEEDPLEINLDYLNGNWKTVTYKQNGIGGNILTAPDFDKLLIKPNGIYGIEINNELVDTGKIEKIQIENKTLIRFISEEGESEILIIKEDELDPRFNSDEMILELVFNQKKLELVKDE